MSNLRLVSVNPSDDHRYTSADIDLLHGISVDMIGEHDRTALYGKIVDAAIAITGSQFGTMQLVKSFDDERSSGLDLLVSRGLSEEDKAVWRWVTPAARSSCVAALTSKQRATIPDYELWDEIKDTPDLEAFRRAGIRSAQTTPLVSRSGVLLGMISTHWREPHEPSQRDLRLLDILARQAADLLDRMLADEALKQRELELERTVAALQKNEELQKVLTGELGHRVKNLFAMVTAIASHSLRGSSDQERVGALHQRLKALSSAHDILMQSSWRPALLRDVTTAAVTTAGITDRVIIHGPDVELGSRSALRVALLVHELATNALKYGSLSLGAGVVDVRWRIDGDPINGMLKLTWRELKGPKIKAPETVGFGSRLVSAGVASNGNVEIVYKTSGLECEITAPLLELLEAQ